MPSATPLRVTLALAAAAAVASALPAAGGEFRLSPYLWSAGFTGTLGVPTSGGSVPGWGGDRLDATNKALLDNLKINGAGMLAAEWRAGRLTIAADWVYVSVESTTASSLRPLYTDTEGAIVGNVGQAAAGWQLYGTGATRIEAYGGARYYDLQVKAELTAGALAAATASGADAWFDGIAGARLEQAISQRWRLTLAGDAGFGGSDRARHALAVFSYRTSWGAIGGGWRLLRVERTSGDFQLDATLSGPLVGATFTL